MKILTIGTDTTIFRADSEARKRIEAYGRLFDELHIIIYTSPDFSDQVLPSGVRLYPTNSRFFFLRPFDAYRIGRRIIRERSIDVLSVQDPAESGLAGWLLKRATGLPLQIQIHIDIFNPFFRKNHWKERLRYYLARFIVPRGDKFRVVSERIKHSLESRIPRPRPSLAEGGQNLESRIMILPIFVDRRKFAFAKPSFDLHDKYPQFDLIILMAARLMREKNIGLALTAFGELLKEFPKTGLVIVGEGPEYASLKFKVESLKLEKNVRFEGWQNDPISYYKTADLYLLTSNFEGYGRSVIEAAAAGLPIIMTDVGVAGEVIRDSQTGRMVPVGDKAALVQALLMARRDYPAMRKMAAMAQEVVMKIEPRTLEEYLKEYRSILTQPKSLIDEIN